MVQIDMILRVMRTISSDRTKLAAPVIPKGAVVSADPSLPPRSVAAGELVTRILAEFHGFIGEFRCAGTERLVKAGVSMTNLHVLGLLSRHGEMPMSRLADVLDVSLSNATGLIDRMEERHLVERVRVTDDRRIVLVRLTAGGNSTLEEVELLRHDLLERLLAQLDEPQLARLADCLSDIHGAAISLALTDEADPAMVAHAHGSRHSPAITYPLAGEHHRTEAHDGTPPAGGVETGTRSPAH